MKAETPIFERQARFVNRHRRGAPPRQSKSEKWAEPIYLDTLLPVHRALFVAPRDFLNRTQRVVTVVTDPSLDLGETPIVAMVRGTSKKRSL